MRPNFYRLAIFLLAVLLAISGCAQKTETAGEFKIDYAKYTLDNGLEVILHEDRSDPIVAVALQFHVGSNREVLGRT
jgi:zinc protease